MVKTPIETSERATHRLDPQFLVWLLGLIALTGGGVLWLRHDNVNIFEGFAWQELLIGYSPLLSALIVIALWRGRGAAALGASLRKWRIGVHWYLLAIVFPFVLMLVAHFVVAMTHREFSPQWPAPHWMAPLGMLGSIMAGSVGEEIGWRGFAQPLLQKSVGALTASVVLGVIWALWHLNAELTTSQPVAAFLAGAPLAFLRMIATAVLYGWLYVRTGASLPVVMLAHAGHNVAVGMLPFSEDSDDVVGATAICALYALAAVPVAWSLWLGQGSQGRA